MRFYGGTPVDWAERTPRRWLLACVQMLPRLRAEERLAEAEVSVFGSGRLKPEAAKRLVRLWQAEAKGETSEADVGAPVRVKDWRAMAGKGVKVIVEPRRKQGAADGD